MSRSRSSKNKIGLSSDRQRKHFAKRRINAAVSQAYRQVNRNEDCHIALTQLLGAVQGRTDLLRPTPGLCRWSDACIYVTALANIAVHCEHFVRPLHTWNMPKTGQRRILASLVKHLLMRYDTPDFMMSAWLQPMSTKARLQQSWHIGMSRGLSIRRMDVPLRMTRRMEDQFLHSPAHFTVEQAMRHSQVLGLGGDENLANAVTATRLGEDHDHGSFWESVILFFINARDMLPENVGPIVDFLYHVKFARREVATENGIVTLDPPCPDFSMKGRSFRSIMRMVDRWHGELAANGTGARLSWQRSSIRDFIYLEETRDAKDRRVQRIWSISQLLTGSQLLDEGRAMGHCAGAYGLTCHKGRTTIWSMTRELNQVTKRVLTIEVDPRKRILHQARAKHNRLPNRHAVAILKKWAAKEGLTVGMHL